MTEDKAQALVGGIVQFNENHKWRGALGFISEVKKCGDDYRCMVGCTMPNNQTGCDTAYIFSMLSKKEFDPLFGKVVLMPGGGKDD